MAGDARVGVDSSRSQSDLPILGDPNIYIYIYVYMYIYIQYIYIYIYVYPNPNFDTFDRAQR